MRGIKRSQKLLLGCISIICAAGIAISQAQDTEKPGVRIESVEKSVVLYTIYRGDYEKIGPEVGKLYVLAARSEITPQGPVTFCYLNNPRDTEPEHYLTEIRIPVTEGDLIKTGSLGAMTDVKRIPAFQAAVTEKSIGEETPASALIALMEWLPASGYDIAGCPTETFIENAPAAEYAQMKTLVSMPIRQREAAPQNP